MDKATTTRAPGKATVRTRLGKATQITSRGRREGARPRCVAREGKGRGKNGVEETSADNVQELRHWDLCAAEEVWGTRTGQTAAGTLGDLPPGSIDLSMFDPWAKHPDPESSADRWEEHIARDTSRQAHIFTSSAHTHTGRRHRYTQYKRPRRPPPEHS